MKFQNFWKRRPKVYEIDPDQVLLDAHNLPQFDTDQFEGRFEKPISKRTILILGAFFIIVSSVFLFRLYSLQIVNGEKYAEKSEKNRLRYTIVFPDRGLIEDRNGVPLVWNEAVKKEDETIDEFDFAKRVYIDKLGFAHLLGYVSPPKKDSSGIYYQDKFIGKAGAESIFDDELSGVRGLKIVETNASGKIESESVLEPPQHGSKITTSIDERIEEDLYKNIKELADRVGFNGGAGAIMDVNTGEILALTSYPEFSSQGLTDGSKEALSSISKDSRNPFLNRIIDGLYTPGSIVKPFMAMAALSEKIITPEKQILSTGQIEIANPYKKGEKTVFKDWRAQGWVDMRKAIGVSSDVYFYEIGGGFENQKGLGIVNIDKYMRIFGFGSKVGFGEHQGKDGVIPTPEWKKENFKGEDWMLGDTYHTAIGQYGFQVTPLQELRAIASIANGGYLINPRLKIASTTDVIEKKKLDFDPSFFGVVREGMRQSATDGTAKGLNTSDVKIAAKTGTAELGVSKKMVNSWVVGFFPYEKPRYAFVVIMERGPRENLIGATYVMRQTIDYMAKETPEYFKVLQ